MILFNFCLTPTLEKNKLIPRVIIGGRRGQSIIHIAVNKKLMTNTTN